VEVASVEWGCKLSDAVSPMVDRVADMIVEWIQKKTGRNNNESD
jgi:Ni,Fe-hydrogenase maturation factor